MGSHMCCTAAATAFHHTNSNTQRQQHRTSMFSGDTCFKDSSVYASMGVFLRALQAPSAEASVR